MGGGLLQLVAYGAQDVYLTGNPQITFFKVVYRRHTNFAIEAIEQSFNGNNNFGSSVSVLITRNGDLIHKIYYTAGITNENDRLTPSDGASYYNGKTNAIALQPYFGQRLLKNIELEIGGQRIDKHFSEWLYIWNELTMPPGKKEGYQLMVGGDSKNRSKYLNAKESYEIYVPLEFWFCRNVGLALPLIALQYHEVKINIQYATASELVDTASNNICDVLDEGSLFAELNTSNLFGKGNDYLVGDSSKLKLENPGLWVDYIFLDTDERKRFAQQSHEYLIEQVQFPGPDTISASTSPDNMKSVRMVFNHPCKELIWTVKPNASGNDKVFWNNFSDNAKNQYEISQNPVLRAKIQLNGNDRFSDRNGTYFSIVQPYQHHEVTPSLYHPGINVYSFALKPEEHQPSGTLNMSRIDTATLSVSSSVTGTISVIAVNYNVLRILSGMGGLAYSN
jgi:hypothetical protein